MRHAKAALATTVGGVVGIVAAVPAWSGYISGDRAGIMALVVLTGGLGGLFGIAWACGQPPLSLLRGGLTVSTGLLVVTLAFVVLDNLVLEREDASTSTVTRERVVVPLVLSGEAATAARLAGGRLAALESDPVGFKQALGHLWYWYAISIVVLLLPTAGGCWLLIAGLERSVGRVFPSNLR